MLAIVLAPIFLTGCNSPTSAPASASSSALSTASYAGALSLTDSLRPTLGNGLCTPSPFLYPAGYLQQQLGLTDSQTTAIERVQDSMKLAFRTAVLALGKNGRPNPDSVRALVLQFKTALENAISPLLTATELVSLQTLAPPFGPGDMGRGDHGRRGPDHDTVMPPPVPPSDSTVLAKLTQLLSLTDSQVVAVKSLQDSLAADTTLTPDGRHDAFRYKLSFILTSNQLAVLESQDHQIGPGPGDRRRGGRRR